MGVLPIIIYDSSGSLYSKFDRSLVHKVYEFPLPILDTNAKLYIEYSEEDLHWFLHSLRTGLHFETKSITSAGLNAALGQIEKMHTYENNLEIPVIYFACGLSIVNQYHTVHMLQNIYRDKFFVVDVHGICAVIDWAIQSFVADILTNNDYKFAFNNLKKIANHHASFFVSKNWENSTQIKMHKHQRIIAKNKHVIFDVHKLIKYRWFVNEKFDAVDKIIKHIKQKYEDKKVKKIAIVDGYITAQEEEIISNKLSNAFDIPIESIITFQMKAAIVAIFGVESFGIQILFE